MEEKITDKKALSLKPKKDLSKLIEPELQVPPPRPMVWAAREWSHRKIVPEIEYLLIHGQAARAWVTRDKSGWESGPEAGPYYNIQYCFETEHSLIHGKYGASFDGLHLAYGSPDFSAWISRAFKKGGTFTVLYEKGNPSKYRIYGDMELYIKKNLLQLAREIQKCKNKDDLDALLEQFLRIAMGPFGKVQRDWKEYYNLMKKMGLHDGKKIRNFKENLEIVKSTIPKGNYNKKTLTALSKFCKKYKPGIWAAKA